MPLVLSQDAHQIVIVVVGERDSAPFVHELRTDWLHSRRYPRSHRSGASWNFTACYNRQCLPCMFISLSPFSLSQPTVVESHPDNAHEDLRLDRPFPGLAAYCDSLDLETMSKKVCHNSLSERCVLLFSFLAKALHQNILYVCFICRTTCTHLGSYSFTSTCKCGEMR